MVVFSGLLIFSFLLFPFYFLYKWYKCLWDYLMSLILSFCSKIFRFFLCFVGLWRPRGFRFVDLLLCSILFFSLMFVFCLCQLWVLVSVFVISWFILMFCCDSCFVFSSTSPVSSSVISFSCPDLFPLPSLSAVYYCLSLSLSFVSC